MRKKYYLEKAEKTEWILAELLACRSFKEIEENCEFLTYTDQPNLEEYYYGNRLILEVEFLPGDGIENQKWVWRTPNKDIDSDQN